MTIRQLEPVLMAASLLLAAAMPAMAQDQAAAPSEAKKQERLLVKAQGICPVMGKDLTKMGGPVKAKVGKQSVFLCCKGCLGKTINKKHWTQIQENIKQAQELCPLRTVALGDDAAPVVVKGRTV